MYIYLSSESLFLVLLPDVSFAAEEISVLNMLLAAYINLFADAQVGYELDMVT